MADYRRGLMEMTPEERQKVAPGFVPKTDVSKPLSVQGAEVAIEATPVGTAFAVNDIYEELKKEQPDYVKVGLMAAGEAIGLVPGLGDVAQSMLRKGADKVVKSKPEEFSGTLPTRHGYTGDRPTEFLPRGEYKGQRYDSTGGVFGDKPLYLEDPENPFFLTDDGVFAFSYDDVTDVDASFDKAFVLTPETVNTLKSKVGNIDLLDEASGPLVVDKLEELGYDGLIIRGFPDSNTTELGRLRAEQTSALSGVGKDFEKGRAITDFYAPKIQAAREAEGIDETLQQSQVLAFRPERQKVNNRLSDVAQAENLLDDPAAMKNWQETKKEELGGTQRQSNPEASEKAAQELFEGKATSQETRRRIREAIPAPQEYNAEQVMSMMPTVTEVTGSLGKKAGKYGILGVKGFDLKAGQEVSSRLDIPAYNNYDTWVVSIHDGTKDAGSVIGFGQAIRLKGIRFGSKSKDALDIARRKVLREADPVKGTPEKRMGKSTIARIFGEYQPADPYALQKEAADIIASGSDEWIQVGMNPYRGSAFYNKATGKPVFEADEVIQVGPLVLAKNVKEPTISQLKELGVKTRDGKIRLFNEGGMAMDEQTEAVFKSSRAKQVDPVSGNEVPTGSLPEEVRDDIPAQLSEGEYVVPADVVRYYGVKFFEDLRTDAKEGWSDMEENGRIGGDPVGPEGMEMVEPEDDLPFDVSELEVREYNEGGMVGSPIFNSGLDNIFASPMSNITQKQYIGPDGQLMMLNFINGAPDAVANYYIGKGFKPADQVESEPEVESPVSDATEIAPTAPQPSQDDGHSFNAFKKESALVESTAPKFAGKTAQDLIQYGDQLVDGKLGVALSGAGMLNPMLGTLAGVTRRAEIFNVAKGLNEKYREAIDAGNTQEAEEIDTAFQRITSRGKERGSGILGGGGLLGGGGILRDVNGDGTVNFFDTYVGDLLDGKLDGPDQSASWNGARRAGGTGTQSLSLKEAYAEFGPDAFGKGGNKLTGPATEEQAAPELTQEDKEAVAKAATQDWVSATQAVKAAGNDPIAQHQARLAQSQASRAATRAIQEANNRTGFFGLQEKAPAPVSSNNAPATNNNPAPVSSNNAPATNNNAVTDTGDTGTSSVNEDLISPFNKGGLMVKKNK